MIEFIIRKKYWFIGAAIAFSGVLITKLPGIIGVPNNQYFQIIGFLIAVIGLFIIAIKLRK